jgi:hypothetical protein
MALINQEFDACIGLSPWAVSLTVTVGKTQSWDTVELNHDPIQIQLITVGIPVTPISPGLA